MLPILSAQQIRRIDALTIERQNITSAQLMERAALAMTNAILNDGVPTDVCILAGPGNNGGDGIAMAKLLAITGSNVKLCIFCPEGKSFSPDNLAMQHGLPKRENLTVCMNDWQFALTTTETIIIDALFGFGLSRPLEGQWAALVEHVNSLGGAHYALDVPSGLMCDAPEQTGVMINARTILYLQVKKFGFFSAHPSRLTCDTRIIDINLDPSAVDEQQTGFFTIEDSDINEAIPALPYYAHKGMAGCVAVIAGSHGMMGAAVMCTRKVLENAGLVTCYIPDEEFTIMQISAPEAMCKPRNGSEFQLSDNFDTVVIGPGLGRSPETKTVVSKTIQFCTQHNINMVIDADALFFLPQILQEGVTMPQRTILTPHVGEFCRLANIDAATEPTFLMLTETARGLASQWNCTIVLKSHFTAICHEKVEILDRPNPALARGGSGDKLAGLIGGLLKRNASTAEIARYAVFHHNRTA